MQEAQYAFPYHYLPTVKNGKFSARRYWPWGFRYMGGIQLVLDQLAGRSFSSLIDIGCGDGRFLREVAERYPAKILVGVDASERAVRMAQVLNPELDYRALDIVVDRSLEKFDVATLIEVIEHIPPAELPAFLDAAADKLVDSGRLIVTVPHRNTPVSRKHYQHFDAAQLRNLLEPRFRDIHIIPFDLRPNRSPGVWLVERVLAPKAKLFQLTNARVLHWFYRLYLRSYLYCRNEISCERLAVVCAKKPAPR